MDMTLAAGTKLGRYEIRALLGAGGMGEVYRARDEKVNRDVAIKVLPAPFSQDADRLRRFEQEVQATGALNHPNILAVYDVGSHNGLTYLVSELLEGETLRQRIGGVALGQRRAIDFALQIAHGLAAAHEKGIVHRDLKPDNIFLTKDGRVKILDFGLAKLIQTDGNLPQTEIPTRRAVTDPGVIVGTVGYMSPEQVRGRAVDHRCDIFAFGAILYEMLSGRRAFLGESAADTMSAILKEDPPYLSDTNQSVSPALARLVNHCLEKNPEERFHSARDLAFALEALSGATVLSGQAVAPSSLPAKWSRRRELVPWLVAAGILLAALTFAYLYFRGASADAHVVRFVIAPPENATLEPLSVAVSPDGRRLAFVARTGSKRLVWVRLLDELNPQPLAGTEGARVPFWSPDSRSIGFFAQGKLKRIEATGGPASTLCDAVTAFGGTWNADGVILFSPGPLSVLYRVAATGGAATPVTQIDQSRRETGHRWPYFLPDGRHFIFTANGGRLEDWGINVGSLDSPNGSRLLNGYVGARYALPGFLLFTQRDILLARPFDAKRLVFTGEPITIARQVKVVRLNRGGFSVSANGLLVYELGRPSLDRQFLWFDRKGARISSLGTPGEYENLELSPDGKRLAVDYRDPQANNYVVGLLDISRGVLSRFTFDPGMDSNPLWSADDSRIVFVSSRSGGFELFQKAASGAGDDQLMFKPDALEVRSSDWSRDGRFIIYERSDSRSGYDLWILPTTGDQKPFPFLQEEFNESQGRFSPDGRWIVYTSDESGSNEVYVRPFPPSSAKWRVSTDGGDQPRWRRDGKELFYLAADRKLMSVIVNGGEAFEAGAPSVLFETPIRDVTIRRYHYDVTADGERFLIIVPVAEEPSMPFIAVLNWTAELKP